MENASKALIIAGAILLSILIISLGIMVYNNAKNAANGGNIDKAQLQAFNSEWEGYVGQNRTASEVRAMYQAVIANNAAEKKNGTNRYIIITNTGTANTGTVAEGNRTTSLPTTTISNSSAYEIKVGYDAKSGLVVGLDWK